MLDPWPIQKEVRLDVPEITVSLTIDRGPGGRGYEITVARVPSSGQIYKVQSDDLAKARRFYFDLEDCLIQLSDVMSRHSQGTLDMLKCLLFDTPGVVFRLE